MNPPRWARNEPAQLGRKGLDIRRQNLVPEGDLYQAIA
jgi:hypothetical protein